LQYKIILNKLESINLDASYLLNGGVIRVENY
jgi:hypothetical protein